MSTDSRGSLRRFSSSFSFCLLFLRALRPYPAAVGGANFRQKIIQLSAEDSSSPAERFVILRQRMAHLPAED
ncbi:MAG: hypothetical protein RRY72_02405 [Bacteroides sp.]